MVDFFDFNEASRWFRNQSKETCITMAVRAALASVPGASSFVRRTPNEAADQFVLPLFRALSPTAVASLFPDRSRELLGVAAAANARANASDFLHPQGATSRVEAAREAACATYLTAFSGSIGGDYFEDAAAAVSNAEVALNGVIAGVVALDAKDVEGGAVASSLWLGPLWREGVPDRVFRRWRELRRSLLDLDPNWIVWVNWYEDRLRGANDARSRDLVEGLEIERVRIPDEDWDKGAMHVNALIAELEEKHRKLVPEQKSASAQFDLGSDGVLHRRFSSPPEARTSAQEERLRAAWSAHEDILKSVEALNPGRNSTALESALSSYRRAMGKRYEDLNVIALGVHGTRIAAVAERADEILMDDAAAEVVALSASHGMFMPQFDTWNEWRADARGELPRNAVDVAGAVALEIAKAGGLADDDVKTDLVDAAAAAGVDSSSGLRANSIDRPPPEVEKDLILVVGNALAALFKEPVRRVRDGTLEGVEWGFKIVGALAVVSGLMELAVLLPAEYGWVRFALKILASAAKAAGG